MTGPIDRRNRTRGDPEWPGGFSPATAAWFTGTFAAPTAAQNSAWHAISSGRHTLVVAPTGSGKTLAAFLWAIDRLVAAAPDSDGEPGEPGCRVLYVSPLKALAVDVERNLRSPLVGIERTASRLGQPTRQLRVGVRSGDTPAAERRTLVKQPPEVLITTPESLFLMLTSAAREALTGVDTVILDEVHAVAGTKRGAHLAVSLERLDALLEHPAQRIGLSATVRPVDEVARFLAGGRPVEIVQPPSEKDWHLQVRVPVPDLGALGALGAPGAPKALEPLGQAPGDLPGPATGEPAQASIWPHVEEQIVDLAASHRSTLVFVNSRRLAERLTARLNEIWADRFDPGSVHPPDRLPAEITAQSGLTRPAPPVLAMAHHGSVSKEQRTIVEGELKAGRLPVVVATSSLELGIDMGAVDLVVQVESPPSVASGLQRVGRAGHQVGAVSEGILFPKFRSDLVQTAVVVERMRAGAIESLRVPANPLDVLAQQIVAMCALDDWSVDEVEQLVHRAAPFAALGRPVLESVLDMLSGRYPSDDFAELRPRVVWDRVTGTLTGRRGAQRLAVTSGGTIPDRGLYAVFLATGDGPGRRVGELDEEMVYESRVGDVFALGTSSWRIEDITRDRVLVTPAAGQAARLPFWKGDTPGRPAELGAAVGAFVRELGSLDRAAARDRIAAAGLDEWAIDNLLAYLDDQREAINRLPTDRELVVERFRDELGDWRIVVHSPFGAQVHAPWALAVSARMRERLGVDVHAMHADDGIVVHLPDLDLPDLDHLGPAGADEPVRHSAAHRLSDELLELLLPDPDEITELVTAQVGGSALFAGRFRECAARALLLPRRRPDRRQPLWQQRQRAGALLEVASRYPAFPIVLEAVRECVQDVYDVPGLVEVLRRVRAREITVSAVETPVPSPFARSLLFGYVAQYLYEGDNPLAERRAAALTLDPVLLAELLGTGDGLALRDLLDPAAIASIEADLQCLAPGRQARDIEDLADLVRILGPLPVSALVARVRDGTEQIVHDWLTELQAQRRVIEIRLAGEAAWAAVEDSGRLRDAIGVALPVGVPDAFLAVEPDPLTDLVARYARRHGPFGAGDVAGWLGVGPAPVRDALRRLVATGRIVEGELRPDGSRPPSVLGPAGSGGLDFCDAEVLRVVRRRSLAALRAEVEPVAPTDFARFLVSWQGVGKSLRGVDGLLRAVEQLSGVPLPASAVESLVLPARVTDYQPAMLDELLAAGDVLWRGHGALPGDDGWVSLHLSELAPLTLGAADQLQLGPAHETVLATLAGGGAYFFAELADRAEATGEQLREALWELAWAGLVSGDTLVPLRARLGRGRTMHRRRPIPTTSRYAARARRAGGFAGALGRPGSLRTGVPGRVDWPDVSGRWSVLPARSHDLTEVEFTRAEVLLDRYGVLTRGSVLAEGMPGGFSQVYRVLSAAEDAGRVRRGYFVEGLGAAQFGSTGAVDRLRAGARSLSPGHTDPVDGSAVVLSACDPANPYGAALPWPLRGTNETGGHQPGRKAGALVVLVDGELVFYVERGGRTLLTWSEDPPVLQTAADGLARAVHEGALGRLSVERSDGAAVLGSQHPVVSALTRAGFHYTPRGLRLRR
ncbi:MAG: ATP-dependent helicase [Actinomycetales bacterium]|nr:MAG: ATP-dependent helicase [Actinomycetales bacterium]